MPARQRDAAGGPGRERQQAGAAGSPNAPVPWPALSPLRHAPAAAAPAARQVNKLDGLQHMHIPAGQTYKSPGMAYVEGDASSGAPRPACAPVARLPRTCPRPRALRPPAPALPPGLPRHLALAPTSLSPIMLPPTPALPSPSPSASYFLAAASAISSNPLPSPPLPSLPRRHHQPPTSWRAPP